MRIVFMGSAGLSCPSLEALFSSGHDIAGVVTQPDRPKGRNLKLSPSPVRLLAEAHGATVLSPENVNAVESTGSLRDLQPDLAVVVAYGQILKSDILRIPAMGCLNMHTSLLPKYRGAAPIQWAIANGEHMTGVTAMYMNEKMDAGDIICQREVTIADDDTGGSLHDKLAVAAANLLTMTIGKISAGQAQRCRQVESDVTFAPKLSKKDGRIDWTSPADKIYNRIRAFNPWPCAFCELPVGAGMLLKVMKARVEDVASGAAGQIIDVAGDGPLVACGRNSVRLLQVQPEGRKIMSGSDYLRGYGLKAGGMAG